MSKKKYFVVKGNCGLGNRLQCLVGAIVYCELTGRELFIDWSDGMYGKEGENSFQNLFTCKGAKFDLGDIKHFKSVYPSIWTGNIDKNFLDIYKHPDWIKLRQIKLPSCSISEANYPHDVVVYTDYNHKLHQIPKMMLKGSSYENMTEDEIIRYVLNSHFEVSSAVKERVDEFHSKHFNRPIVGIHVRYTDLPVGRSNRKYHEALQNLLEKYPDMSIFLATDNRSVLREFQEKYANLCSLEKWYPQHEGDPMHECCDSNNTAKMATDAVADMVLLSECDYLICCKYSSFTFFPLHITSIPKSNIITVATGDLYVFYYWKRRKLVKIKQRICSRLLGRRTLFKKSLNLL